MVLRPCLGCGVLTQGSRCTACRLPAPRKPSHSARRPDYDKAERRRRAETVRAWIEANGYVCPGWGRPPHPSTDLTADHVLAVAKGGAESGEHTVLCRSCNGAKSDR